MLNNIGLILDDQGKLDEGLNCFQQALTIAEQLGDLKNKAISLNNIGGNLYKNGKKQQALETFEEALVLAKQIKLKALIQILERAVDFLKQEAKDVVKG